jgi:hypothetical protein
MHFEVGHVQAFRGQAFRGILKPGTVRHLKSDKHGTCTRCVSDLRRDVGARSAAADRQDSFGARGQGVYTGRLRGGRSQANGLEERSGVHGNCRAGDACYRQELAREWRCEGRNG